ncbi:MAG: hypothetical protein V5A23_05600 [Halobacteriales archaeon]
MAEYEPGVCNIGRDEQRMRLRTGLASFAVGVAYTAWVIASGRPPAYLLGTFALATGGFLGYVQYRLQFCAAFGAMARYNLTGSGGEEGTVLEDELHRKDRRRALEIVAYSLGLGLATTLSVYALFLWPASPLA